jgi:hypothetical protein
MLFAEERECTSQKSMRISMSILLVRNYEYYEPSFFSPLSFGALVGAIWWIISLCRIYIWWDKHFICSITQVFCSCVVTWSGEELFSSCEWSSKTIRMQGSDPPVRWLFLKDEAVCVHSIVSNSLVRWSCLVKSCIRPSYLQIEQGLVQNRNWWIINAHHSSGSNVWRTKHDFWEYIMRLSQWRRSRKSIPVKC